MKRLSLSGDIMMDDTPLKRGRGQVGNFSRKF